MTDAARSTDRRRLSWSRCCRASRPCWRRCGSSRSSGTPSGRRAPPRARRRAPMPSEPTRAPPRGAPAALARARPARADALGRRRPGRRAHPGASGPAEPRPRARRAPTSSRSHERARAARRPWSWSRSSRCCWSRRWRAPRFSPPRQRGEQAGQAAQAGAMALLQGGDPRAAARRALPAAVRRRAAIGPRPPRHGPRPPAPADRALARDRRRDRRRRPGAGAVTGVATSTADAGPDRAP